MKAGTETVFSFFMNNFTFQDYMTAVQAVILFLGLGLTVWTLRSQKKDAKNLATLNLIIHQRNDSKFNDASNLLTELIKNKNTYSDLSSYLNDSKSKEAEAILTVLNFREFVSVGINNGIIDEKTYKNAFCSVFVRDWNNLENTIKALRKSNNNKNTLFQDFEVLAKKWIKQPLKVKVK